MCTASDIARLAQERVCVLQPRSTQHIRAALTATLREPSGTYWPRHHKPVGISIFAWLCQSATFAAGENDTILDTGTLESYRSAASAQHADHAPLLPATFRQARFRSKTVERIQFVLL
jgi:hypothetical protein